MSMSRRGALAALGAAAGVALGARSGRVLAASLSGFRDDVPLHELTAREVLAAFSGSHLEPQRYAEALIQRWSQFPELNAWISRDDGALRRAAAAAEALPRDRYPLAGLPFGVKDNIDVAGWVTTAGTPALTAHRPKATSPTVAGLLDRGALMAGKLNLHELAAGGTSANLVFGPVRNPYDLAVVPGGSSGGTAAAVAARLLPAALGTDTGGSCRLPAALCGCVGFRPSQGRYATRGVVPRNARRDTIGWMARSAADIRLLDAFSGKPGAPARPVVLAGLRLGVPRAYFYEDLHPEVEAVVEQALVRLADAGAVLVEADVPRLGELRARAAGGGWDDFLADLDRYLREHDVAVTAEELAARVADPRLRRLMLDAIPGYRLQRAASSPGRQDDPAAAELRAAYEDYFADRRLDALVIPTSPIPAPPVPDDITLGGTGPVAMIRNTGPSALAGLPGLSMPAGLTPGGLPVGVGLEAPWNDDATLLAIGESFETVMPPLPAPPAPKTALRSSAAAAGTRTR